MVIGKLAFIEIVTLHKQIRMLTLMIMLSPYTQMKLFQFPINIRYRI